MKKGIICHKRRVEEPGALTSDTQVARWPTRAQPSALAERMQQADL
jgi:hypothetical protein